MSLRNVLEDKAKMSIIPFQMQITPCYDSVTGLQLTEHPAMKP